MIAAIIMLAIKKFPAGSSLYNLSAKTSAYSNNLFDGFEPCFSV